MKRRSKPAPSANHGCPCPQCGSRSRVLRTSVGMRLKTTRRDFVLRERICLGRARHRFQTEERPR